jgi:hypothetical protein
VVASSIDHQERQRIVASCLVVSFLQMVSCWFWLIGFARSKLDNVFSEGLGEGEEMNCFGLVGAEVILAVFQCLFTAQTIGCCWTMRNVYRRSVLNRSTAHTKMSRWEQVVAVAGMVLPLVYTCGAFITAQNQRCKQGNHYFEQLQHHFYPIYIGIDVISSTLTWYWSEQITCSIDNRAARASVLSTPESTWGAHPGVNPATVSEARNESTLKLMQDLAVLYKRQTILSIVVGFFAVGIFIVQFVAHVEALSLIACIFCVCM